MKRGKERKKERKKEKEREDILIARVCTDGISQKDERTLDEISFDHHFSFPTTQDSHVHCVGHKMMITMHKKQTNKKVLRTRR